MTRTEERLADALQASAGRVSDDRLRPLLDQERRASRGVRNWLVPAGAAAAVVLAVVLALAVAGVVRPGTVGPRATPSAGSAAALPKYFATISGSIPPGLDFTVRSSSTGAVVAHVRSPMVKGWTVWPDTTAAGPDGHTFYLECDAYGSPSSSLPQQIWIYRLSVPGGRLTRVAVFPGAARFGTKASLAVSPDGRRLALTAIADPAGKRGYADAVVVVDLRTGARHTWQGGLYRPGRLFMIQDLSWTADGRSLAFLGLWCDSPSLDCAGTSARNYYDAQVRSLSLAPGGGTLGRSVLLVSRSARYPVITDVAAGPGPAQLTLLVLSGRPRSGVWPVVSVDRVSAANGALLSVAYRADPRGNGAGQPYGASISADPGGKNLLFTYPGGRYTRNSGWSGLYTGSVSRGKLTLLPFRQPYDGWRIAAW